MQTPVEISAKILLAEDDNDMRRFLVKALQNAGYVVTSFDNGLSAYNRLREEPFELLLTDIVMPEMDGIELARRATELDPEIKVMFITGFAAVALNPDNAAPKDARILSKPFHLRDLVNEVERLLTVLDGPIPPRSGLVVLANRPSWRPLRTFIPGRRHFSQAACARARLAYRARLGAGPLHRRRFGRKNKRCRLLTAARTPPI